MIENFDVSKIVHCYKADFKPGRFSAAPRKHHGLVYFYEADSSYLYDTGDVKVKDGWFLFLPKGTPYVISHKSSVKIAVIDVDTFQSDPKTPFSAPVSQAVEPLFSRAIRLFEKGSNISHLQIKSVIYQILAILGENATPKYLPTKQKSNVDKAIDFINQSFTDPSLSVDDVAEKSGYGKRYFSDCFKSSTGLTPNQYVIDLRIRLAKRLLVRSDLQISEIAYKCGFKNEYYFSSLFKARTGETPTFYRKSRKNV